MKGLLAAFWGATGGATLAVVLCATLASASLLLVTAGTLQTFIGPGPAVAEPAPLPAAAMPTEAGAPALQPTSDTPPVPTATTAPSPMASEPAADASVDPALSPGQSLEPVSDATSPSPDQTDEVVPSATNEPAPSGSEGTDEPSTSPSWSPTPSPGPVASPSPVPSSEVSAAPSASPPVITSPPEAAFVVGAAGTFSVTTAAGSPAARLTITCAGSLPDGLTFLDNGDGTAAISGTPASGTEGAYEVTLTASDGVSPDATQRLTISVSGGS
jgi:hypothetical protein